MKKFTRNFLLGEHSIGRFLRKIGLSLVVLLWTFMAFAQEPQSTLEVWAKDATFCYQADNTYEVDINMKDFVSLQEVELKLNFNSTEFDFDGFAWKHAQLTALNAVPAGNVITITWSGATPITIAASDDAEGGIKVATLEFSLKNTPFVYTPASVFEFTNALIWGETKYKNLSAQDWIITTAKYDGDLVIEQGMQEVVVDIAGADCDGTTALATVTTPANAAGMTYHWNNSGSWTTSATSNVNAPSTNQSVEVRNADGCITYIKRFDVTAPAPLTWYTNADGGVIDNVTCPGGNGTIIITAEGGTPSYTYYVVPQEHMNAVILELYYGATTDIVKFYRSTSGVFQKPEGIYYVAVQDANGCAVLSEMDNWEVVAVVDDIPAFEIVDDSEYVEDPTCNDNDGEIAVEITGGTPFDGGVYNIYWNGVLQATQASSIEKLNLATGSYTVVFEDANGCTWSKTYTIERPEPIAFDLEWTDTGCQEEVGTITVMNITGGEGPYELHYTAVLPWGDGPIYEVTGPGDELTATGIAAGVYYVRVMDDAGCVTYWENEQGDKAVKILDTDFDYTVTPISCYGDETTVVFTITTGSGNHEYAFRMYDGEADEWGEWMEPEEDETSVTFDIAPFMALDTAYVFEARDITADCDIEFTVEIEQPEELMVYVVEYTTQNPSCPSGTDGTIGLYVEGGTMFANDKYHFKLNEGAWTPGNALHTILVFRNENVIWVKDANDCVKELALDFSNSQNHISFVDEIELDCADDEVVLLAGYPSPVSPDVCSSSAFGLCLDNVTPEDTYFKAWETVWHGTPMINFVGNPDNFEDELLPTLLYTWVSSLPSDVDTDGVDTFEELVDLLESLGADFTGLTDEEIFVWLATHLYAGRFSDDGETWMYMWNTGMTPLRTPMLKYSTTDGTAAGVIANGMSLTASTSLGAGTYYIAAVDQFGCISNVDTVVIAEPLPLELIVDYDDAGCFGYTDGWITIDAENVSPIALGEEEDTNYYLEYVVLNNGAIFNNASWDDMVNWLPLFDYPHTFQAQAGEYWIAVRDYCGTIHSDQIEVEYVKIESADAIDYDEIVITNVTCNVAVIPSETGDDYTPNGIIGSESSDDGTITVTGVTGGFGNYEYLLELEEGDWSEENTTGEFSNLPAGFYTLTITDEKECYIVVEGIEVTEPDPLELQTVVAYPSCYGEYDGFIRYMISGGTAPFYETTNNVGQWEDVGSIPANRWYKIETEGDDANATQIHDFWAFDRRVRAGNYEIYIRDAHGCIYGPVEVHVDQPDQLGISSSSTKDVSCVSQNGSIDPVIDDGSITVTPEGGWNTEDDGFYYNIQLWFDGEIVADETLDVAEPVTFDELEAGTYTIRIFEYNSDLAWDGPIIGESNYFMEFHEYAGDLPYQNADVELCDYTEEFVINSPAEIDYDIEFWPVLCRNTATGSIEISNATGGTGPYWFGLEGPDGSNYEAAYGSGSWEWVPELGSTGYVWDDLKHGHYNIYIKDANGCVVFRESAEINNADSLMVNMDLIHNAVCFEGLGQIEVLAEGGTGEYVYAVSSNTYNFNLLGESGLEWQASPIFNKPAGIWVGYVKDSNDCIQGGPTTSTGAVIQNHRVTILQPTEVDAEEVYSDVADDVTCYGLATGKIQVDGIDGGNGGKYSAIVTGYDYAGNAVNLPYAAVSDVATSMTLTGLKASTNKDRYDETLSEDDMYRVVIQDNMGCESDTFYVAVFQPDKFEIELKAKQDAFICSDDLAGIFDIVVVSGGVPFNGGTFKYKWIAMNEDGETVISTQFGFTNTFLGEAGLHYYVTAEDANGCQAFDDVMVEAPAPVVITEVKDLTCFGATAPKARITVTGEEGRTFEVQYQQRVGGVLVGDPSGWIEFSDANSHEIETGLTYGDANDKDGHYRFWVRDEMGCESEYMDVTFVPVQAALFVNSTVVDGECTADVTVSVNGGIAPYEVWVNGVMVENELAANTPVTVTLEAHAETQVVVVRDAHECLSDDIEVDVALPADIELEAVVCTGEDEVHYVNEEYGIDEMLNLEGSPYEYTYTTEGGCVHNVIVIVVEDVCMATIAEIQGEADESPMVGHIRKIDATVTAVVEGVGYFAQDASEAWSGIWVLDAETEVAVGDGIHVWGEIAELDGITTLIASEAGEVVEATIEITAIELEAPADLDDEMYESVLVYLHGVRAMEAEEDGSWTVFGEEDNTAVIGNLIYEYEPVAGNFYDVTGVVLGHEDGYVLLPRMEEDVVDLTKTTDVNVIDGIKFKVYPNPFNNELNIDNHDKLTRVTITNIAGQRVMDVQYPERVIRTANLVSGVYVVTLFNDNGIVQSERIVKR